MTNTMAEGDLNMKNLGYYNGEYGLIEEIKIPMNDRVCYFGDGVYEATLCSNHTIFALDDHIDRFYNSAKMISIQLPMRKEELKETLRECVKKVDSPDQFVYWQATRGTADRTHAFPENATANLWIMLRPCKIPDVKPRRKLIVVEDTRFLHCNIKTLNLLPNVMAAQRAKEAGCYEAVFHRNGRVTEGAHTNISILREGRLITAPCDNLILPGITRAHLIRICERLSVPVMEEPFTLDELFEADEVLVTSASTFCILADQIDGRPVGGKATTLAEKIQDEMMADYHKETKGNMV